MRRASITRAASVLAATSQKKTASEAKTPSEYVKSERAALEFKIVALEAELAMLNSLAEMNDDEKFCELFELFDKNKDGTVDVSELADGLRKLDGEISFGESIRCAIEDMTVCDSDMDAKLNKTEFKMFVDMLMREMGCSFHDLSEFLVMKVLFAETHNTLQQQLYSESITEKLNETVIARESYNKSYVDRRMRALFEIFDLDKNGTVDFKEVAIGLYKISCARDMETAAEAAIHALLSFDANEIRPLSYSQFASLIVNIIAASGFHFDDIADDLTKIACQPITLSDHDVKVLNTREESAEEYLDFKSRSEENENVIDAVKYGKMRRLFELWDLDHNGKIDLPELALGLRKFFQVKALDETLDSSVIAMMTCDEDGDHRLDFYEFTRFVVKLAKASQVEVNEMIDFLVVETVLRENDALEEAYIHATGKEASSLNIVMMERLLSSRK